MKIKSEHYIYIKNRIEMLPDSLIKQVKDNATKDSRTKDLNKRIRWDLYQHAIPASWTCDNLYPYMNDDHIDTALRAIVSDLNLVARAA